MLAIMSIEWSHIEYAIVIKKILTKCKPQEWKNVINQTIKENNVSDIVPIKVKIYYISQHLDVM